MDTNLHNTSTIDQAEKRLDELLDKFWDKFKETSLIELKRFVDYPGGFKFITEKEANKEQISGVARTVKMRSTKLEKLVDPYFEVRIVKEKFIKLTDSEILFMIAHEYSHMIMKAGNSIWAEYAADLLAEHYWGIKNPKGSSIGYINN